jgi:sugar lactone lactonase YvrE
MIAGIIITSDDETLYYVSQDKGLIRFDLFSQEPTYLLSQIEGKPIPAMNNLCIDEEKQIVFITDCSTFKLRRSAKDLIMKRKSGRIISFNLKTSEAKVILSNLAYPNGIVFHKESQSIIFTELTHHMISKLAVY